MQKQSWTPESYERHARFVSDYGHDLLAVLSPQPGERILDLGCGDGALTVRLMESGSDVVAVDASAEQVAAAKRRGIDARVCDVRDLPFVEEFEAIFSNAVLHWVSDTPAALRACRRALRPGGRFVAELGGAGNVEAIRTALTSALKRRGIDAATIDPWTFPTLRQYREHLELAGFRVEHIELRPRPTSLPGDLADWLRTFAQPFLACVDDPDTLIGEVSEDVRPSLHRDGTWVADYVRLRFTARREPTDIPGGGVSGR